jgi:hypothetical protein
MVLCIHAAAQITSPQVKANFGIDADLRGDYMNVATATNTDDWFLYNTTGNGKFVIDTTGAQAIRNAYVSNPATRNQSVIRNMSLPVFSHVNGKTLIDAVFVRDFHGDDSTIFASGANKNGMNPVDWSTPESQSVPDKNEILDIYMHVRRDGRGAADSLWMFGAVSIENVTGNRYFDFEMFQTDILYNRSTNNFSGYGPDAGHTAWELDASGNIIKAGDIILTAEYGSSSLTMIEARIWVNQNALSISPGAFSWSGLFDGAYSGAQFGYASIKPKTEGAFYSGLQNSNLIWGGAFGIVTGNNSLVDIYGNKQFMEFSVNLTKLGLDPVTVLGGSTCNMPFQKVMVKTRASTSFTAALKDFVAPFGLLNVAKANIFTTIPVFCGVSGVSNLKVINPVGTSVYTWETIGGHISDSSNKTSVYADEPGTYVVHQKLQASCPVYATDTLTIRLRPDCGILLSNKLGFNATLQQGSVRLKWNAITDEPVSSFGVERSSDGVHFAPIKNISATQAAGYNTTDWLQNFSGNMAFYRLALNIGGGNIKYSSSVTVDLKRAGMKSIITLAPNPIVNDVQLYIYSNASQMAKFHILDSKGNVVSSSSMQLDKGNTAVTIPGFAGKARGIYTLKTVMNNEVMVQRFVVGQ